MKTTIRLAGAQIPITPYAQSNVMEIRRAIDWASENSVDYLVTPEASLSGYTADFNNDFNRTVAGLAEIEKYAAKKNVGLCLGTLWDENENGTSIRRNQIRFYQNNGNFLGYVNKHYAIEKDHEIGVVSDYRKHVLPLVVDSSSFIPIGGLVCVDMYGIDGHPSVPGELRKLGANLLIHATNGHRNVDPANGLSMELYKEIQDTWHDINLRRFSFINKIAIVTVDNCYMMDGSEYHGETSSQSGVIINGEWVTSVPRTGTQYFYHDLKIEEIALDIPEEFRST